MLDHCKRWEHFLELFVFVRGDKDVAAKLSVASKQERVNVVSERARVKGRWRNSAFFCGKFKEGLPPRNRNEVDGFALHKHMLINHRSNKLKVV